MKKVTIGLLVGLGALAWGVGPARAETGAATKTGDTTAAKPGGMNAAKPAMANGTPQAKDKEGKEGKATNEGTATARSTKPGKMMCEDFLSLDEVTKPKVLYWAEGFSKKGKPEDAVFDIQSTERLVPTLVEVCQKEPKASFMKKVKAEGKKTP